MNVSNSFEETESDGRRYRRQRSREGSITSISGSPLHSILEEDKKKNITVPCEKIQTHTRNSSDSSTEVTSLSPPPSKEKQSIFIRPTIPPVVDCSAGTIANKHSIYIRPIETDPLTALDETSIANRRIRRTYLSGETNNKIEIDSDNIETPPSVRKNFNNPSSSSNSERTSSILSHKNIKAPRPLHKAGITDENGAPKEGPVKTEQEVLGDGQFDRHSATRRTRRFKRPTDLSSTNEENATNNTTTSPDSVSDTSFSLTTSPSAKKVTSPVLPTEEKSEERPKKTIEKQKKVETAAESKDSKNKTNNDVVSRIGKIGKSISRISQEDVREAIRSLKSPTPEKEWNVKDVFRTGSTNSDRKLISHELNDEGFEETQSLVSDTPSLGTSSCNEDAKSKRDKPLRLTSTDSAVTTASETPRRRPLARPSTQLQTLLTRNQQSLERSRSLRVPTPPTSLRSSASSTPRRTNSLRRPETQQTLTVPKSLPNKRLDVERSNSRTSLRSSRSSLNSAVSTNTVIKKPLKPVATSSITLPKRTPLVLGNNTSTNRAAVNRVPASRSSSSGSSIGPTVRKPPTPSSSSRLSSSISTSFKENQNTRSRISPASNVSSTSKPTVGLKSSNSSSSANQSARASGGFMRPTAASAVKVKTVK